MHELRSLIVFAFSIGCAGSALVVEDPAVRVADVWASSAEDIWVVGAARGGGVVSTGPNIAHFDGVMWSEVSGFDGISFRGVWGAGPDDVWAVGDSLGVPIIAHYDGSAWARFDTGVPFRDGTDALWDVAGSGANDVWAVGVSDATGDFAPFALHFDGAAWSAAPMPNDAGDPISVAVTRDGDVWMLDRAGAVFRRQGVEWSRIPSDVPAPLHRVEEDDGTIWIAGAAGIGTFDGSRFVARELADTAEVRGDDAWLAGDAAIFTTFTRATSSCDFAGCERGIDTRYADVHVGARATSLRADESLSFVRFFAIDGALWVFGPSYWRLEVD
jgi:hypothetical protein